VTAEQSFTVEITAAGIADLHDRLDRTRWPAGLPGAGWDYGTDAEHLRALCGYWRQEYDLGGFLGRVNQHPQYVRTIGGERLHYYHLAAPGGGELPVLLLHGWPGTVTELLEILGPLHAGGARAVVAPSLPGYGWSAPTTTRGVHAGAMAARCAELMAALGYDRYAVHGGDWGAVVAAELAAAATEHVAGAHFTMLPIGPPEPERRDLGLNDTERAGRARVREFRVHETGYQAIQGTKPQTLAYGLTDSPAGLAGWITEKFHSWTGVDVSFDRQLDVVMTHWFGGTLDSAMRLYYEQIGPTRRRPSPPITVPTGYLALPAEILPTPRAWAARAVPLVHWTEAERGGHFPAMEVPAVLAADIAAFTAKLA
jgi:pimeloyl-ACP methyl ester carboxylesterase